MAARFWVNTGSSTNWSATVPTNWAATSGSTTKVAVPGASDDVTFDGAGNGNSASVVSANITILSLTFTAGYTNTVTINTGVALTIAGNFTDNTAHSWTVSGTGAMTISATSAINSGGKTFPGPVTFSGANTKTITTNDWTITGTLTISSTTTITARTMNIGGGLAINASCSGTTNLILNGTGSWSGTFTLQNNLTINTAGTITIGGSNMFYNGGTLTYTAGSTNTSGSLLTFAASTTLNTNGITWNNITVSNSATLTVNSLFSVAGTMTIGAGVTLTFAGTSGITVNTLTCSHTGAATITLVNTVTYTIITAFNAFNSRTGSILLFTSDHASNKAILILAYASTTCNVLASFTRIDASGGRPIITFNGTITTCINIVSQTNVKYRPLTSFDRWSRRCGLANKDKTVIYQ